MIKIGLVVLSVAVLCLGAGVRAQTGPTISIVVSGAQLAAANGTPGAARPQRIAEYTNGKFLLSDNSVTANIRLYIVDPSTTPVTLTKLTDTAALRLKVDADNGNAPAPVNMSMAAFAADEAGNVYIATDGADPEIAYLFRIRPEIGSPEIICGLDGVPSSIEGLSNLAVFDGYCYLNLVASFQSVSGDTLVRLRTDAPAGGKTAADVYVSEATLLAATGTAPNQFVAFRSLLRRPATNSLVTANSANATANDDFLEVNLANGAVSVLVRATDIESDLATTDIGQSCFSFSPDGSIFMVNQFNSPANAAPDESIIKIHHPGGGVGEATVFATQQQILASPLVRDLAGNPTTAIGWISNEGILAIGNDDVIFSDGTSRNVIRLKLQ